MNFQTKVNIWIEKCFGKEIGLDQVERKYRFFEEATELVQATGFTREQAHKMVDYVYNRPVGELPQEIGGVMNCVAALCTAYDLNMEELAETELNRCWAKLDLIREKQKTKPRF